LRSALSQARRDGLTDVNEAERVTLLRIRKTVRRQAFSELQLRSILKTANAEWKGMILFGLYTGLRLGDIATLTWHNLDLEQNEISLATTKTGRQQVGRISVFERVIGGPIR
jgi:integrase